MCFAPSIPKPVARQKSKSPDSDVSATRKRAQSGFLGLASTQATGSGGLTDPASVAKKQLLGQ